MRALTFEQFYAERYTATARLAYSLCGSELVSEDLAQEAFLALESRFGTLENPAAYLRTTLVRLSIDHHRRQQRLAALLPKMYSDRSAGLQARELLDVLERLSMSQRTVLVLRYWAGLGFGEIAELLGCRVSTTKSQARRGLAALRKELESDEG